MHTTDVIIVGAGPSGCAAAYDLLQAGLSVAILDKHAFPRLKPCAGGLTMKTLHALRYSVQPVIRQTFSNMTVGLRLERSQIFAGRHPIASMTVRQELDAFSLQTCRDAGADFHVIGPISHAKKTGTQWQVNTQHDTFSAKHLIAADGANSHISRLHQLGNHIQYGVAVETTLPIDPAENHPMAFDFGYVDHGYAWIFPKHDHLNIGIYSLHKIPQANHILARYIKQKLGRTADERPYGHRIPYGGHAFRHIPDGPLLVGDAAGLIDPLLGEGIYNATVSGQLAATAIIRMAHGQPDTYGQLIRQVTRDLKSYWFDTRHFYANIDRGYRYLTLPPIRYTTRKGYALGYPIRQIKHRLPLIPFSTPKTPKSLTT